MQIVYGVCAIIRTYIYTYACMHTSGTISWPSFDRAHDELASPLRWTEGGGSRARANTLSAMSITLLEDAYRCTSVYACMVYLYIYLILQRYAGAGRGGDLIWRGEGRGRGAKNHLCRGLRIVTWESFSTHMLSPIGVIGVVGAI